MPPRARVSREQIEDVGFQLVRAGGMAALTARGIADALGVSTQPVYTACVSMPALQEAVSERIHAFAEQFYAAPGGDDEPAFLRLGLRTLALARDEPEVFRLVAQRMRARLGERPPPAVERAMRADPRLASLPAAELRRVHTLLWIFSQGAAALIEPGCPHAVMDQLCESLRQAGEAVIEHAAARAGSTSTRRDRS
ncbi:MAG: TetR/AcrR family transcriptional regulator [Myxococcales bacterium]|nr:TetR/AcrR family transcriptional regulator [Myxococcales bacterium]